MKKPNYNHLMVDIETMGNQSGSAIVSIAAVEFCINTGKTRKELSYHISLQSCMDLGMKVNADTVLWWLGQDEHARKELNGIMPITKALKLFAKALEGKDYTLWGNSASFDLGLLTDAYQLAGIPVPWKWYNERCVRTLAAIAPAMKKTFPFHGIKHNALYDCHYQIGYVVKIWNAIHIYPELTKPQAPPVRKLRRLW